VFEELILVGALILGVWFVIGDLANLITEKKHAKIARKTSLKIAGEGSSQNVLELVKGNPTKLSVYIRQVVVKIRIFLVRFRNRRRLPLSKRKNKLSQIKNAGKILIFTILIISTFFLVMRNNTRYLNQITIMQGQGYHESLRYAYLFLEGYAEEEDRVMTHQINWGMWYTKDKLTFIGMLHTWGKDHIWYKIQNHTIQFVVISEWDSFHPFEVFEISEYAKNFTKLWTFAGSMGVRTTIYVVKQ